MRARSAMASVLLCVGGISCAHAGRPKVEGLVPNDGEAIAYAIEHTVRAAPKAHVYVLEVNGAPADERLLKRVAELTGWQRRGHELRRQDMRSDVGSRVFITASAPAWRTIDGRGAGTLAYASVATSYQVGASPPILCEVHVAPPTDSGGWSMRTTSDLPCWTKAQ